MEEKTMETKKNKLLEYGKMVESEEEEEQNGKILAKSFNLVEYGKMVESEDIEEQKENEKEKEKEIRFSINKDQQLTEKKSKSKKLDLFDYANYFNSEQSSDKTLNHILDEMIINYSNPLYQKYPHQNFKDFPYLEDTSKRKKGETLLNLTNYNFNNLFTLNDNTLYYIHQNSLISKNLSLDKMVENKDDNILENIAEKKEGVKIYFMHASSSFLHIGIDYKKIEENISLQKLPEKHLVYYEHIYESFQFISDFYITSSKEKCFTCCNSDNAVKIINIFSGEIKPSYEINNNETTISCITIFYKDLCEKLVTVDNNDIIRVWNIDYGKGEDKLPELMYYIDIKSSSINSIFINSQNKIITTSNSEINIFSSNSFNQRVLSSSTNVNSMNLISNNTVYIGSGLANFVGEIESDYKKNKKELKTIIFEKYEVNKIKFEFGTNNFIQEKTLIKNSIEDNKIKSKNNFTELKEAVSIIYDDKNKIVMIARSDKSILVFQDNNKPENYEVLPLKHHKDTLNILILTSDNKYLISGSKDKSIQKWKYNPLNLKIFEKDNENEKEVLFKSNAHADSVMGLALDKASTKLISIGGNWDHTIKIWNFENTELIYDLESAHNQMINSILLTNDDKFLISGSKDKKIRLWSLSDYRLEREFSGHQDEVTALVLTKNNQIISGSRDKSVKIWNLEKGNIIGSINCNSGAITCIAISKDNSILATAGTEKKIRFWKLGKIHQISCDINNFSKKEINLITCFGYNETKEFILAGYKNGDIKKWKFNNEKQKMTITKFTINRNKLEIIKILMRNKEILIASKDNKIRRYEYNEESKENILLETNFNLVTFDMLIERKENKTIFNDQKDDIYYLEGTFLKIFQRIEKASSIKYSELAEKEMGKYCIQNLACIFYKNEIYIATGGEEKKKMIIKIWKRGKFELNFEMKLDIFNSRSIISIKATIDGKKIITYSLDRTLNIIDWRRNFKIASFQENIGIDIFDQFLNERLYLINGRCLDLFNDRFVYKNDFFFEDKTILNNKFDSKNNFIIDEKKNKRIASFYWKKHNRFFTIKENSKEIETIPLISPNIINYYENYNQMHEFFKQVKIRINDQNLYKKNPFKNILDGTTLIYPYYFNFLHLNAFFSTIEENSIYYICDFDDLPLDLCIFLQVDYQKRTCIDILIELKKKPQLIRYFTLIFKIFNSKDSKIYYKKKFLSYVGTSDEIKTPIFVLLNRLLDLFGKDTEIIKKILDISSLEEEEHEIDESVNYNSNKFQIVKDYICDGKELFKDPNSNHYFTFTEKLCNWLSFIVQVVCFYYFYNKIYIFLKKRNLSDEEKNIKYKFNGNLIGLRYSTDFSKKEVSSFYERLYKLSSDNPVFESKTLKIIAKYKWNYFIKYLYIYEFLFFMIGFAMFLLNYTFLMPLREQNGDNDFVSIGFNSCLIIFFLGFLKNEINQIKIFSPLVYISSEWNFVDLILIFLGIPLFIIDICNLTLETEINIKILSSMTMFVYWLRIISYFRGFSNTGNMVRLIKRVIFEMRYFLLLIMIFNLTFSFSAHLLQINYDQNFFDVFILFYRVILGDLGQFDDLKEDSYDQYLIMIFFFFSTILMQIILLNLLISIIGSTYDKHVEKSDAARNYELLGLIYENEKELLISDKNYFEEKRNKNIIGPYLFYLEDENDNEMNNQEKIDNSQKNSDDIKMGINELKSEIIEIREKLNKKC